MAVTLNGLGKRDYFGGSVYRFGVIFICLAALCFAYRVLPARAGDGAPVSSRDALTISRRASGYFEDARRRMDLQTELPEGRETIRPAREWPAWLRIKISRGTARVILYASLAFIFVITAAHLMSNRWSSSRRRIIAPMAEDACEETAAFRMETAQIEADDLAEEGCFAEAIHVLLLRSVAEIRLRLSAVIASSLTSREILALKELSPQEREVFADIVRSVEVSYFGGYVPGAGEYTFCRRSFEALTGLLRQGRAS
jgi:hypothetical protein